MSSWTSGSPQFAGHDALAAAEVDAADRALAELQVHKGAWATTSPGERIKLLGDLLRSLADVAQAWVQASAEAKELEAGTSAYGEEWLVGPCIVARNLRLLRETIADIERRGQPKLPGPSTVRADGQVVAPVFPTSFFDRLVFRGTCAEVWMQPEVSLDQLPLTMAVGYARDRDTRGQICLVLCAGNVSSIGPMDMLYKLFVENQVVLLKMNPVNDYLTAIFAKAFEPLVKRGVLRVVSGGASLGEYLCQHERVDAIHITGSDKTHDAIVYGTGDDQLQRKRRQTPVNTRPITSELGNVSPVIVVPGPWSNADIAYQAELIASSLLNNAGFNCAASRVLVTHQQWSQREALLSAIETQFATAPTRRAYYPGAADRFDAFVRGRNGPLRTGVPHGHLPWALLRGLDPADAQEICFTTEAFCSLMGETSLPADSLEDYLAKATRFANERLWGSLNVTLLVHPTTLRDRRTRTAWEKMVAELRYGTVSVNHWAALSFGLVATPWGAFPGHPPEDIQSGTGFVHNTFMFSQPQKSVVRGPFRTFPKPIWFSSQDKLARVGPALLRFEISPSCFTLPAVAWRALV